MADAILRKTPIIPPMTFLAIDIGNTRTEIMDTIGVGSGALQADGSRKVEPMFPVEDAARAVLMMANMPPSASVGSGVVTAAGMPFIGRG